MVKRIAADYNVPLPKNVEAYGITNATESEGRFLRENWPLGAALATGPKLWNMQVNRHRL